MAKTKKKHSGKPRGMNYADMLARKRMIREAVQEAADDATVQLRADMATQKALWLAVCSVADAYGFGPERMKKFFIALQENNDDTPGKQRRDHAHGERSRYRLCLREAAAQS